MARNDPTDTGGLFIGRRPGTAPVHYAAEPEMGSPGRRRVDRVVAAFVLGIAVAFAGMIASLMLTLLLAVRLDAIWKVVRRAAGYDQRDGALSRIFMVTAIVAAIAFGFWFLILEGPAPSLAPQ